MPAIKNWLNDASHQLAVVGIPSATLDAEIIMAFALGQNRTYLHAHPEQIIESAPKKKADKNLILRLNRIPIAYILGYKEFYGRQFLITPATLIPRPESENIITVLHQILPSNTYRPLSARLIDIGTGSGCLGITAKLEFPNLDVTLTDISDEALQIATQNSKKLSANVTIIQSDLLQNCPTKADIVIANLPYVDRAWKRSPETNHEPALALFAPDNGLAIIKKLITQTKSLLNPDGYIIIEADPTQHSYLIEFANKQFFKLKIQSGYVLAFVKQDSL